MVLLEGKSLKDFFNRECKNAGVHESGIERISKHEDNEILKMRDFKRRNSGMHTNGRNDIFQNKHAGNKETQKCGSSGKE